MVRPGKAIFLMIPFLILVGLVVLVLHRPLIDAFMSNPVFNGIIMLVFVIGIIVNFRQVGTLSSEVAWINAYRKKPGRLRRALSDEPRLLAPLAKMLNQHDQELLSLSHLSLRSLLDSVRLRLDESRDVSHYMIGLLIFLGLLGTFWGLLITVDSVGKMIGGLSGDSADTTAMFGSLMEGLHGPLSGMGTAFSSSLFGLAGSLVLGFLDLQATHAQNRFYNELEDWLSGITRLSSGAGAAVGERELGEPAYIHAMLEQTAETLDRLQRNAARDDEQRHLISDQILALGRELAVFSDLSRDMQRVAETRSGINEAMQVNIRSLDQNIKHLSDEIATGREQLSDQIRDELRLIGRALSAEVHGRSRTGKQPKAG